MGAATLSPGRRASLYAAEGGVCASGLRLFHPVPDEQGEQRGVSVGLLTTVLVAFVAGIVAVPLVARAPRHAGWLLALAPAAIFVYFAAHIGQVVEGQPLRESVDWVPSLGMAASFNLDGLALLLALLITGIGALVVIYAGGYLRGHAQLGRFYLTLFGFMAAMLGIVIADNVILLYVFWALTGFTSYLLIGFDHTRAVARANALQALLVTFAGELALLAGLLLLARAGDSFELSTLITRGDQIAADPLAVPILVLLVIGAVTKSAQFPFHFWLPNAMEAPTPVSAYLHSATMVKAGVYLLARTSPIFSGDELWLYVVGGIGAATMLLGAFLALRQTDLKRLLAYSTVSALGVMVFLLGLGSDLAVKAAIVFLLGHALYKGALFLVAGALDHETGVRDATRLGGLARLMPFTAAAAGLAALSMAGLLPFFGFIGKELIYETTLLAEDLPVVALTVVALVPNIAFVVVAGIVGLHPFVGARPEMPRHPHEAPPSLLLGPLLLGGIGVFSGLLPGVFATGLASAAVASVTGAPADLELALWHGLTPMLLLSAATITVGAVAFGWRGRLATGVVWLDRGGGIGPERAYGLGLGGLQAVAEALAGYLQSGLLRRYLVIILVVGIALVGYAFVGRAGMPTFATQLDVRPHELAVAVMVVVAAVVAAAARSRLAAIAAIGVVGYGVALLFLFFGAPDLAMTQILIETLTVILFVLVLYHLPRFVPRSSRAIRIRDAIVAGLAGLLMTGLSLAAFTATTDPQVSAFFAERSLPDAHGRNIVNVILVDFRALDTLGEITVLALAALGVYGLLHLRPRKSGR
jgi:multicomponent Na+:H+ antiporter subunit A